MIEQRKLLSVLFPYYIDISENNRFPNEKVGNLEDSAGLSFQNHISQIELNLNYV